VQQLRGSGKQSTIPPSFSSAGPRNPARSQGHRTEQNCTALAGMVSSGGKDTGSVASDKTLHFSVSAFLLDSVTDIVRNKCSQDLSTTCTTAVEIREIQQNQAV